MTQHVANPKWRTIDWLAKRWSMHPESLRRRCREGTLPGATKLGGKWRIRLADVEAIEQTGDGDLLGGADNARSPRPGLEAA